MCFRILQLKSRVWLGGIHALAAGGLVSRGIGVNAVAPGPVYAAEPPADEEPEKVAHFGEKPGADASGRLCGAARDQEGAL